MKYCYHRLIFLHLNILFNFYRFIGELYKQQILTTKIMHRCIRHLLDQNDEDNLECLCKLLTTIGKDLESKGGPSDAVSSRSLSCRFLSAIIYYLCISNFFLSFHRKCKIISAECRKLSLGKVIARLVLGFVLCCKML